SFRAGAKAGDYSISSVFLLGDSVGESHQRLTAFERHRGLLPGRLARQSQRGASQTQSMHAPAIGPDQQSGFVARIDVGDGRLVCADARVEQGCIEIVGAEIADKLVQ